MPDKLSDSEIVKDLECCSSQPQELCCNCPIDIRKIKGGCITALTTDALDLINRQKAEIEVLRSVVKQNHLIRENNKSPLSLLTTEIKAEAYKECIEKVKALFPSCNEPYQYWEIHEGADNILKELVGEDNG